MEQPSAAAFQAMLEAAQAKAEAETEKTQFTPEEADKFKKAFDDPEFRRMFSEYVEEMSDPKNREETEMYISQLEGEQKVPQGKELIRPLPSFVAKTHKTDASKPESKGDKIWLNIVMSDKIAEPTKTVTPEGESWSLPYSLGPPHMERDQKDANVAAFDCCFHPTAIALSSERKKFRDLLVQTAIEGVEEAFRRQKQETKVCKEFHVLKGVSYKSGQVPAMLVDISSKKHWNDEGDGGAGVGGAVKNVPTGAKAAAKQEEPKAKVSAPVRDPAIKKGFLNAAASSSKAATAALPPSPQPNKSMIQELPPAAPSDFPVAPKATSAVDPVPSGPVAPIYSLKERGSVSWGDFEQMRNNTSKPPTSTRPAELICRIEIPKVTVMADMLLDVSERRLQLSYRQDYLLSIALPYPVLDKKGVAKYDKTSKCLTVTLPVQPPVAPIADAVPAAMSAEVPTLQGDKEEDVNSATHEEKRASPKNPPLESSHKRWVSTIDEEETKQAQQLKEEIKLKAEKARLEQQSAISNPIPKKAAVVDLPASVPAPSGEGTPDFSPSAAFTGKRPGCVFKRGDKGVGYYVDTPQLAAVSGSLHQLQQSAAAESTKHFLFEARQTLGAVAVLVQVPAIDPATVTVSFHKRLVQVKFASSGGSEGKKIWHSGDLVPLGDLDAAACRFDIVQRNMVLVLTKQDEAQWNDDGAELVSCKPYSGTTVVATATTRVTESVASHNLASLQKSIDAMSFAQKSSVLFELD